MMVSTKGRYALRIMIDLAEHEAEGFVSLKDVACRQGISMKYMEAIVAVLNKAGLLNSRRGKTGGYRLSRDPGEITAGKGAAAGSASGQQAARPFPCGRPWTPSSSITWRGLPSGTWWKEPCRSRSCKGLCERYIQTGRYNFIGMS